MASPTNDRYVCGSGAKIYAGRYRPLPAWLSGKPLNEWFPIPNTSGAGGSSVDDYCGLAIRDDLSELWSAAAGGHGGSTDNRVVSIRLSDDAPAWTVRKASSTVFQDDVAYYSDGTPAARHTYHSIHWIPGRNRLMLHGFYGASGNASSFHVVDGFNPDTNQWDAAGTWPDAPGAAGWYGFVRGNNGDVWYGGGVRWNQAANNYSTFSWTRAPRFPGCHDSTRNRVFTLQYGDSQGFDTGYGVWASVISATGVQTLVTLTDGGALTELQNNTPVYSGMDYDPILDKYCFYPGVKLGTGPYPNPEKIYLIDPVTYAVSTLALGAGSVVPNNTPVTGSGIQSRFRYVPNLRGFVMLPQKSSNLYFIRTA